MMFKTHSPNGRRCVKCRETRRKKLKVLTDKKRMGSHRERGEEITPWQGIEFEKDAYSKWGFLTAPPGGKSYRMVQWELDRIYAT